MTLPHTLESLLSPQAYPHAVQAVQVVETHISWILLTGQFAYKVKRPVALAFVDLRSPKRREFLCHEEVRLNRRFAPDVYVGVCSITADEVGARIDGTGQVIEHAVKMHQFDRDEELDTLLMSHRIKPVELETFGGELARIHAGLPSVDPADGWGRAESVRATILRNLDECIQVVGDFALTEKLCAVRLPLEQRLEAGAQWIAERHASGKVRECHGDLHCSNIVRQQSRLIAFDCLEFEPAFRWIDVADEVAFLLADLEFCQRPAHMQAFLGGYLAGSGDYHACQFLDLYAAHRSLVRAKVMALGATDSRDPSVVSATRERCDRHLSCAHARLSPKQPMLILMSGLSGSGKTWLATRLALPFGAVHIRSDIERKRLAGLSAADRSRSSLCQDLYSPAMNVRLHQHLLRCTESTLSGGYTTIVDATFSRREDRRSFAELARRLAVNFRLVHCHAPLDVLRSRIEERERRGGDPSEANVAVLEWQQQHYEPVQTDESFDVFEALTSDPSVLGKLKRYIGSA